MKRKEEREMKGELGTTPREICSGPIDLLTTRGWRERGGGAATLPWVLFSFLEPGH